MNTVGCRCRGGDREGVRSLQQRGTEAPKDRAGRRRRRGSKIITAAFGTAVLVGVVTNALTGIGSAAVRAVWAKLTNAGPVVVHSAVALDPCGAWVLPDGQPGRRLLPRGVSDSQDSYRAWVRQHHAVQAGTTIVNLAIRGGSSDAVVLQDLRVRILDRSEPVRGTVVQAECGGPLQVRHYSVNLDNQNPVLRPGYNPVSDRRLTPAVTFPYRVTHADPEVMRVVAFTDGCDCTWVLELVYVDGQQQRVMRIDDDGQPFRTAVLRQQPA